MDPYAKIHVGATVFRTKTHTDAGKFPMWHEIFSVRRTTEQYMQIYIYDASNFGMDTLICEGQFPLSMVCTSGAANQFANSFPLTYKGKPAGDIFLEITFYPDAAGYPGAVQPGYAAAYPVSQPMCTRILTLRL